MVEPGESRVTRRGRPCESALVGLTAAARVLLTLRLWAGCIKIWFTNEDAIFLCDRLFVVLDFSHQLRRIY